MQLHGNFSFINNFMSSYIQFIIPLYVYNKRMYIIQYVAIQFRTMRRSNMDRCHDANNSIGGFISVTICIMKIINNCLLCCKHIIMGTTVKPL